MSAGHGPYALSDTALDRLSAGAQAHGHHGEDSLAIKELAAGVSFWRSRAWPPDFHNADYKQWARENPHGDFTISWWGPFLKTLQEWIATRPISGRVLTDRFMAAIPALTDAWHSSCEPFFDRDITSVTWEEVKAFPTVVATIKPTRTPSSVFTSKFCHFLLPRVFPVVDNEALGGSASYDAYFRFVQNEWSGTQPATQAELAAALRMLIESGEGPVFPGFPMVNKIVELRVMGRRHPGGSSGSPLAPLCNVVVQPNDWQKHRRAAAQTSAVGGRGALYVEFWTQLLVRIAREHPDWTRLRHPYPKNWIEMRSPLRGCHINPQFAAQPDRLRLELYIDTGDADRNMAIFDYLKERREQFETAYGRQVEWEDLPHRRACRVADYKDGSAIEQRERFAEYAEWFIDAGHRMRTALAAVGSPP